jgi:hypothetical protein
VLLAVGLTSVGAVIVVAGDATTLGFSFKAFYIVGCVAAVLAVRRRALFTAVAQPPLVLSGVAVITLYFLVSGTDSGIKKLIFNVALPMAKLFPLMGWTFLLVLAIGAARFWLTQPRNASRTVKTGDRKTSGSPKKEAATSAPRGTDKTRPGGDKTRTHKTRTDQVRADKARTGASKPARPQTRAAVAAETDAPAPTAAPRPRVAQPPRPPVRTSDPRPRATERSDDLPVPPRRRRAAPEAPPEARPRRAATYDDQPPPPGARAYRGPNDFIYAPPPRMRDRDLR